MAYDIEDELLSNPLGASNPLTSLFGGGGPGGGLGGLGGFKGGGGGDFSDYLAAVGLALATSTDRRAPFANLPQTLALMSGMSDKSQQAEAMKFALKQAGFSEQEATLLSRNPAAAKQAMDLKQTEKANVAIGGLLKGAPPLPGSEGAGGGMPPTPGAQQPAGAPALGPLSDFQAPGANFGDGGFAAGMPSMAGQPMPNVAPSAATMASTDRDDDLAIRTIAAEASSNPDEMLGVASVIRNRVATGKWGNSPAQVVLAKNQFEPWNPNSGNDPREIDPSSPKYQAAKAAWEAVKSGQAADPTNGATHFFAPRAQAALGRSVPAWAQGQEGIRLGATAFYAPEGRVTADMVRSPRPTGDDAMVVAAPSGDEAMVRTPSGDQRVSDLQAAYAALQKAQNDWATTGAKPANYDALARVVAQAEKSGGMVRRPTVAMDDTMERRPAQTNDSMVRAPGQIASADPAFMPAGGGTASNPRLRTPLGNGGQGLSQLPESRVVPASQAYAPSALPAGALSPTTSMSTPGIQPNSQVAQAQGGASQSMSLADAMRSRPTPAALAEAAGVTPQAYIAAQKTVNTRPPPDPSTVKGATTQRALALRNFQYWTQAIVFATPFGDKGKGLMEVAKQNLDLVREYLKPDDVTRKLLAMGIPEGSPAYVAAIGRSLPDNRPTDIREFEYSQENPDFLKFKDRNQDKDPADIKSAKAWGSMTDAEKKAYREQQEAKRPQQNTIINNVANPLLKGGAEEADDIIKTGREASRGIYTLHEARAQLDKPGGINSGFGADYIQNAQRIAGFFGGDASKVVNTETYKAITGQAVLQQAKTLGANPSNEDARRIDRILGGNTELNEATLRQILDFQESLLRRKVREANDVIDQHLETYSDQPELMKSLKARRIREPSAYEKPQVPDSGEQKAPAAKSTGAAPKRALTRGQYDALQPGEQYLDPNGNLRVKGGR